MIFGVLQEFRLAFCASDIGFLPIAPRGWVAHGLQTLLPRFATGELRSRRMVSRLSHHGFRQRPRPSGARGTRQLKKSAGRPYRLASCGQVGACSGPAASGALRSRPARSVATTAANRRAIAL
jgi:hypothetical protein